MVGLPCRHGQLIVNTMWLVFTVLTVYSSGVALPMLDAAITIPCWTQRDGGRGSEQLVMQKLT